jgi:alpha-tubulin suppressor-like RCC1 family protein
LKKQHYVLHSNTGFFHFSSKRCVVFTNQTLRLKIFAANHVPHGRSPSAFVLVAITVLQITAAVTRSFAAGGTVFAWGDNGAGQTNVPAGLSNVVAIASGDYHSLALRADGTVVAWGLNTYGATNVPTDLTNAVAIGGGLWHSLALRSDGTLEGWGVNSYSLATPPADLSNVVTIACGMYHNLAVKNDGTVVAWGDPSYGCTAVPPGLSNVIAVAAGYYLSLALKSDGTVVAWGDDFSGMSDVPPGLTNVQAISSQCFHSLALNPDGSVVSWGYFTNVPASVSNAIAIAAGGWTTGSSHSLVLKNDGTMIAWGTNDYGQGAIPAGIPNVAAIAAGSTYNLALLDNPSPHFSRQPVGQTVYSGVDVTLRSAAFGPGTIAYQWCANGTNISGATNTTLTFTNAQPPNSGNYTVIVTNAFGTATSFVAPVHVIASPPLLTLLTTNYVPLTTGGGTTFQGMIAGSLPLTCRWLHNSNEIAGANTPSLTISNVSVSDGGVYTLVVTNQYGSVSTNISVIVYDLPTALDATNLTWVTSGTQLWYPELSTTHDGIAAAQSDSIGTSENSVLQTTVNGPGTLSFWWKFSPGASGDTFSFSVNGSQALKLFGVTDWQQQTVYLGDGPQTLQWARSKGSAALYSCAAWLDTVSYTAGPTAPILTAPPADHAVNAGSSGTIFSVGAVGTPPLMYEWQFTGTNILGATNASLSLTNVQAANAGQYTVTVTNLYGSAISNCNLTVTPTKPFVTVSPENITMIASATVSFTAKATGSEPFAYQWRFKGTNIDGATLPVLTLTNIQVTNSGAYSVVVTNAAGSASPFNVTLTVMSPAMVIGWGNNNYGQINFTTNLTNAVEVKAGGYHTLVRKSDNTVVAFGLNSYGQISVPAGLSNVVAISAGNYHSLALKSNGTVTNWGFNLGPIPAQLSNVVAISAGGQHNLALKSDGTVVAWGSNTAGQTNVPAGLSNIIAVAAGTSHSVALDSSGRVFAWGDSSFGRTLVPMGLSNVVAISAGGAHTLALKADGTVVAWGDNSSQQTSVPLGLTNVAAISAGLSHSVALKTDGTIVVWGAPPPGGTNVNQAVAITAGSGYSAAILNNGSPFISQQPQSRTIFAGSSVFFKLVALGASPFGFQWQCSGTNIDGATNSTLTLTNVPLTGAGNYQCLVTNPTGSLTSRPATLVVLRPTPQFANPPGTGLLANGFNLQLGGLSGHGNIVLYASTNLTDWDPILTNDPATGTLILLDSGATNFSGRFYRAQEQ